MTFMYTRLVCFEPSLVIGRGLMVDMSHRQIVRAALEEDIITGRLSAGDKLDEQQLATRFAVSRTPVREAIRHLEAQGIVQVRPRLGAVVASFTIPQIIEMFELMAYLESLCARLAARRMNAAEKDNLKRCHEICGEAAQVGEFNDYYLKNVTFHEAIYEGAHNGYLQEQTLRLRSLLAAYRRYQLSFRGRIDASYAEHGAIVRAIMASDAEAASASMLEHVSIQGDAFTDFLTTFPGPKP